MQISMSIWLFIVILVMLACIGFLFGTFWQAIARVLDYDEKELFDNEENEEND